MVDYFDLLQELLAERGTCEMCTELKDIMDCDHAVYPKAVYRGQDIPELDHQYNCILLCRDCHTNKPKYYRQWAWEQNCARYGRDVMNEWRDNLPLKIKTL